MFGDIRPVLGARKTVLGRKQGGDLNARSQHQIHVALAIAAEAGLIRDQPDSFALQRREVLGGQNVQARSVSRPCDPPRDAIPARRWFRCIR